jgi:transcriptional regulator with XRE-family HTH domain
MSTVTDEQALRTIADNLRRLRGEMSYSEIARRCSTYPAVISRIEKQVHMPGAGLLSRIADALGCSTEDLLSTPLASSRKK